MFFTPGWGAVLTLTGTLGGVAITQAANSALSWRTTRKDRNKLITESVAELISSGNAWVYATSTQEQDVFHAVATGADEEKMMSKLVELRAALYKAQLSYGRALAVVRLTCPPKVLQTAEAYGDALLEYETETRSKGSVVLDTRSVQGLETTKPTQVVSRLARLVEATRKATGNKPPT